MNISTTRGIRPQSAIRNKTSAQTSASESQALPSDSVTLSGGNAAGKALTVLAGGAGLAAGIALGSSGGWTGALGSIPAAAGLALGAGSIGLVADIAEGINSNRTAYTFVGLGLGAAAGAAVVAAGAVGGAVGGGVVGVGTALVGAGLTALFTKE